MGKLSVYYDYYDIATQQPFYRTSVAFYESKENFIKEFI